MTICERKSGGRILCIRLSGLGDVVHALNALTLLRRERPDAYIGWLVEDRFADLLRGHPYIDELITIPRHLWGGALKNPFRWGRLGSDLWQFGVRLRRKEFEVTVDFQSSLKSTWLVVAADAEMRVGFGRGVNRELNHVVQNELVRVPTRGIHRIERDLALLAPLGIPTSYADPVVPTRGEGNDEVDQALAECCTGGPIVVIHPGTSRFAAFKRWHAERYARVGDALVRRCGADVLITFGPGDRELAESVAGSMRQGGTVAPCTGNLRQLAYLLSHADLFIGSDTGPMHIASALKVPVVALFGPKDPEQTGPYCSRSIVVTGKADCSPCTRRRCSHVRCMASIHAHEVLQAALDALDGAGECRGREGPMKKPLTWRFQLGRWQGEITTCYSRPEFFKRLCNPDALLSAEGSQLIKASSSRDTALVPAEAGAPGARLVVKRYRPKARLYGQLGDILARDRALNSWRSALRLGRRGIPIPFPVCYMVTGSDWRKEQVLIAEDVSGAVTLYDWLMADDMSNWRDASAAEKVGLISRVATLIRGLHASGYYHADLRPKNILIDRGSDGGLRDLYFADTDRTKWVGWLPPMWRDIFFGLDLRRLACKLKVPVSAMEVARFFRCYCDGFMPERHRQRALRRIVRYPRRHGGFGGRRFRLAPTGLAGEREEVRK